MTVLDLLNSPWAIRPETLTEMCGIYTAHRSDETTDFKAVEAALGRPRANQAKHYQVQDGVAVIPLEGIISKRMSLFGDICGGTSTQAFQDELAGALSDPSVSAIILSVDSPGGNVDGVQAASDAVFAARKRKPIAAWVDGQMASAAYWIGSAASQVFIGADTDIVGSIGIVTQHVDTSNAEHQRGVKITDITAGKYKRIDGQHAPLSREGRDTIQDQVDQVYGAFVDDVARNRGVNARTVLSKMADGRVFIGQQSVDAGIADGKMILPQLIQHMKSQKGAVSARVPQPTSTKGTRTNSQATNESATSHQVNAASVSHSLTSFSVSPATQSGQVHLVVRSDAEQRVDKLRLLKQERNELQSQLKTAEASDKSAAGKLWQAKQARDGWERLVPFVEAKERAANAVRTLRVMLVANDKAQLAVLRG